MDGGTQQDFAEFAAAQTRPLLGFAHALTANPHDAWDLTQETFARMGARMRKRRAQPRARSRFWGGSRAAGKLRKV